MNSHEDGFMWLGDIFPNTFSRQTISPTNNYSDKLTSFLTDGKFIRIHFYVKRKEDDDKETQILLGVSGQEDDGKETQIFIRRIWAAMGHCGHY